MAGKKKKSKHAKPVPASDLVNLAENHLGRGDAQKAIELLRSADAKLKQKSAQSGKKVTIPPHLAEAQEAIPGLLARAFLARSLSASDPKQKLADLEEAVKIAPGEHRYLLARGAALLSMGRAEAAFADFQKADEMRPGDGLILRAFALGLLANGRAPQAKELLERMPADNRDTGWHRIATLCGMIGGLDAQVPGAARDRFPLLIGLSQLARGESDAAGRQFSEISALNHNPSDAEAVMMATQIFYSGALKFAAGHYGEAVGDFTEAGRLAQSHRLNLPWQDRLVAYLHKTAENVVAENPALADQCWREAVKLSPDEAAHFNLSQMKRWQALEAWRDGNAQGAADLWLESLQSNPQDEGLLKNLAIAIEKLDRQEEALTHWRALARLWRQQARSREGEAGFKERLVQLEQHIAKLMIETDQSPNEVVNELEVAVKFDPGNPELRRQVAERLLEVGRPHQAIKHLDEAERLQGESSDLFARKATVFASQRRTKDAQKCFQRALDLDPSNAIARRGYVIMLGAEAAVADERDDVDRARELCEQQLALDPNYHPALGHLASLYFSDERDAEAIELLDRLVKSDPNDWTKRFRAGRIYLQHGYNKEAEAEFEQVIKLEPGFDSLHDVASIYLEADEVKKAFKYFNRAAEIADVDQLLDLATHAFDADRAKDAERYLDKAKILDPSNPMPYLIKAMSIARDPISLLIGLTKPKDALKDLREAERLMEGRAEYAKNLEMVKMLIRGLESGGLPGLGSLLGSTFDFDDDDDEPEYVPRRSRRRRR
jgi:tetratricopeptide (TPR) repeat protein